jgi:signal transduction histidine kinase
VDSLGTIPRPREIPHVWLSTQPAAFGVHEFLVACLCTSISVASSPTSTTSSARSRSTREELLGQDHRIINSGHHPKEFIRGLWRTIAQGQVWRGELRNRAKDGSIYWVDTTIVPLLNADGKPHQYLAIRSDITQRKAVEQQLADQAALAQLGQLATVVAHEVRNPLAGVKGSLQVLRSRPAIDPDDKRVIDAMISRLDVLNNKVEDILRFARPRTPVLDSPGRIGTAGRLGKRWSGSIGGACCRWRRRLIGDVL